jgi:exopolyphosphatase / guanosine-5'-triphosphate,3'-diphosphate pyrophosphatase
MRRAIIDIGTNSVKLLIAEVDGPLVRPVWEGSEQTRLGKGFYESHRLQPSAISETAEAVAKFAFKAVQNHAASVRVIATSAVRDATNQSELVRKVRAVAGIEIEIITGEQEADWVYAGVRSDPALRHGPLLILELGGGSSEFILGDGPHPRFRQSFPMGTVRLHEQLRPSDPPSDSDWAQCHRWLEDFLSRKVAPVLRPAIQELPSVTPRLVGTGGTTALLASMELGLTEFDRDRIEQTPLSRERVRYHRQLLWGMSLAKRRQVPGLPANKADVILFGVAVFDVWMDVFGFNEVRVSTRGLRFGAVRTD